MASVFKEVSKIRRCPICNKPDYCCFTMAEQWNGKEIVICKRDTDECNQNGYDGKDYVYLGKSHKGNSLFMQYAEYQMLKKQDKSNLNFKKVERSYTLTPVGIIAPKADEYLDKIYRYMVSNLRLEDYHRQYLHGQGWSDELIDDHQVVSMPESDYLRALYKNRFRLKNPTRRALAESIITKYGSDSLIGVPGAYVENHEWTFHGRSGILFPMYNMDRQVKRLRIRMDFRDENHQLFKDSHGDYYLQNNLRYYISMQGAYSLSSTGVKTFVKGKGKYRTLSSFMADEKAEKEGFLVNMFEKGCQSLNEYSLYMHDNDDKSIFLITEGEPKAAITNDRMHYPVLSAPGVTSYQLLATDQVLNRCKAMGMKIVIIATDADKYQNQKVLVAEHQLIYALQEKGIIVGTAEWSINYGKGIDDCLVNGYWPEFAMASRKRTNLGPI